MEYVNVVMPGNGCMPLASMNGHLCIFILHLCCYHKRLFAEYLRAKCVHPDIIDVKKYKRCTTCRYIKLNKNRVRKKNVIDMRYSKTQ